MKFSQGLLVSSYRNLNATRAQVPPASAQLLQLTVDHMNPSNNLNKSTASTAEYPATAGGTKSYFVRYIMPK